MRGEEVVENAVRKSLGIIENNYKTNDRTMGTQEEMMRRISLVALCLIEMRFGNE